jgi:serine phosphatase RsbU (regulator of sigma subunit)
LWEQEKKLLEKNRTLQQSKLEAQTNRERYFKAIAILVALIFVSGLYGLFQIRLKNQSLQASKKEIEAANLALAGLNEEIQTKNNSITDSIYYARGIQEAILPEKEKWKSIFPDSFIFYKPKDIVSGDFYFLTQHRNKWFLAFADCTGHGVPGALMSMIGHNLLTSAIEIHNQTDPGVILLEVDEGIRKTLKTQTSHSRDSMELGICIFDFEADQMTFAGSMRSLLVFQNGALEEWKGDRHPLGSDQTKIKNFTLFQRNISSIDAIYMFTDGYQDQLGGPEVKRFSSARLKALLTGAQGKSMMVQEKLLEFTMKDWVGEGRQLDDMMVLGIRLQSPSAG